jgi:transposase InsO family protein
MDWTAHQWAEAYLNVLQLNDWGIPRKAISDRDSKFTGAFWTALFRRLLTKLAMSTANHPQANGQTERQNQTIGIAIRFAAADYPEVAWVDLLPAIQHNLNNAHSDAIGRSPNELVYGLKPAMVRPSLIPP